jgi:hypothetical protein
VAGPHTVNLDSDAPESVNIRFRIGHRRGEMVPPRSCRLGAASMVSSPKISSGLVSRVPEDGLALDPLPGQAGRVVRPRRVQLAAAAGLSPVAVPGVPGKDAAQVAFTEYRHPAGHLRPGGEHEPFRRGIARPEQRGRPSPAGAVD